MRGSYVGRVVPALLIIAIAGCKDSSGLGKYTIAGSSDVNVSGAVTASVDATAMYAVSDVPSTTITLQSALLPTPAHTIVVTRAGARPATGSYAIGSSAGDFSGTFVFEGGSTPDRTFVLTGGTINITSSSERELRGAIVSATAAEGVGAGAPTVAISGTFTARCMTAVSAC